MYPELFAAFREQIAACWSTVDWQANGIYRVRELKNINFETKAQNGQLPIVLLDFRLARDFTGTFGATNFPRLGPVRVMRVDSDDGDGDTAVQNLVDLMHWFETHDLSFGQRWGPCEPPRDSDDLPANQYFLLTRKPFWVTWIEVPVVVAEHYS